jgi:hypothetical protein
MQAIGCQLKRGGKTDGLRERVAPCGCPIPANSEGSLGWHLRENHTDKF